MEAITLSRTGLRPLAFDGELLAEADGFDPERNLSRYHTIAVYRTAGGRYVVSIRLVTRYQGENDRYTVEHADDPSEIERALRDHDPCPPGIGYPPREAFAEKQAQLAGDMRRRYDALVTELFDSLGGDFAERIG